LKYGGNMINGELTYGKKKRNILTIAAMNGESNKVMKMLL
jgi:hypothetical protein